jgi:hypothetical protein
MATRTPADASRTQVPARTNDADTSRANAIGGAVSDAAETARGVAGDAVSRLPDVAATTRSVIEDANRQMRSGSDEMLTIGTALSFGFAVGLLVGGANRLFIAAALLPAAMMGLTMLDRSGATRGSKTRGLQGG